MKKIRPTLSFNAKAALLAGVATAVLFSVFGEAPLAAGLIVGGLVYLALEKPNYFKPLINFLNDEKLQRQWMPGLPGDRFTPKS